ncbi:MAG: phosphohydrolase [Parvularcula sp.]|nr:phosphohydrolase [Parvularcula sp.]
MPTIPDTKSWVSRLHDGQVDKAGAPYIGHVVRVFQRLLQAFPEACEDIQHAALLHDAIEDCEITPQDLRNRGYSEKTIEIVEAVTKKPEDGLTYAERIERLALSGNRGAIQVKICGLMDNSDPKRFSSLPEEKAASLSRRYQRALSVLTASLEKSV